MADEKEKDQAKTGNPPGDPEDAAKEVGADQVQAKVDEENEQGFRGTKVDPTPDEHYSVAGVVAGLPTPETDARAHAEAHYVSRVDGRFPESK